MKDCCIYGTKCILEIDDTTDCEAAYKRDIVTVWQWLWVFRISSIF